MGLYLNPDNKVFEQYVQSGSYVDKTGVLVYMNGQIGKPKHLLASSRPRRFGKTMTVKLLAAYYSKGCDSGELFQSLEIAKKPSFEEHLNQYDVINLDIQGMRSVYLQIKDKNGNTLLDYIQSEVLRELKKAYPDCVDASCSVMAQALSQINNATGNQFVILIDEWDCFFREEKHNEQLLADYIIFLRSLFKGDASDRFVKLAYITGILPIKKYGTESALNNFRELTMVEPEGISQYIGFTEEDVKTLCKKNDMPFEEMQKWYDGYYLEDVGHIYCPNSVMEAVDRRKIRSYWSKTETYESLKEYIEMNFDGLKDRVVEMLAGQRCRVNVNSFQNDMTTFRSADDVLTLLIHLGYLAYDSETREAFIPNLEVRESFETAVTSNGWEDVRTALLESEELMYATLQMEEEEVAERIRQIHESMIPLKYYNHEQSLATVIMIQ